MGLEVFSGTGDDDFLGFPTPGSSFYGGYGEDLFRPVDGLGRLPTRNLGGVGVYPSFNVNFYGGNDKDVLIVDDSRNTTPREYNINSDNWSNAESRLHWTEVDSFDSGVIRLAESTILHSSQVWKTTRSNQRRHDCWFNDKQRVGQRPYRCRLPRPRPRHWWHSASQPRVRIYPWSHGHQLWQR